MSENQNIKVTKNDDGLLTITFSRPGKKNAIDVEMMTSIASILNTAADDEATKVIAFTGVGDYFSSGFDLTTYLKAQDGNDLANVVNQIQGAKQSVQKFVAAFIDCPKILVAVVNGPAVGIGVTILGHFDIVFASDLATFHCPFTQLGLTLEGCSSLLFPLLMGQSKATHVLILGKKISAYEGFNMNLVTEVIQHNALPDIWDRIRSICKLPPNTVMTSKSLIRRRLKSLLHEVNNEETEVLSHQWQSEEFLQAFTNFFIAKSKL